MEQSGVLIVNVSQSYVSVRVQSGTMKVSNKIETHNSISGSFSMGKTFGSDGGDSKSSNHGGDFSKTSSSNLDESAIPLDIDLTGFSDLAPGKHIVCNTAGVENCIFVQVLTPKGVQQVQKSKCSVLEIDINKTKYSLHEGDPRYLCGKYYFGGMIITCKSNDRDEVIRDFDKFGDRTCVVYDRFTKKFIKEYISLFGIAKFFGDPLEELKKFVQAEGNTKKNFGLFFSSVSE